MITVLDRVDQISITKLREWGYLDSGIIKSGTITWSIHGTVTDRISIASNMTGVPYIELDYKCGGKPYNYRVWIESVPSNLGKGEVLYFRCPHTHKLCRKLYFVGGEFLHRDAFIGSVYDIQTESRREREFTKFCNTYWRTDKIYEQLRKKHFKKQYAGKPTKKYTRLMDKLRRAERIPAHEYSKILRGL